MSATETVNYAREYVEQQIAAMAYFRKQDPNRKILGDPTPVYEFVLENGVAFKGTNWKSHRGKGYRRGKIKECFPNAWDLAFSHSGLSYYEGYAYRGIVPVHHAWVVNAEGQVIDPTWRYDPERNPESEWHYFGVPFDLHALAPRWIAEDRDADLLFQLNDVREYVLAP